jgi:cation diffusion facilitator family transporter
VSAGGGTKAIIAALVANLGIAATKFIAWLLTSSSSMLAESIHSVADSGNQALLLLGGKRAKRRATAEHPFGYGRERYIYAFIVSIVLFSVGGLFALYEAWHKIQERHPIEAWQWVPVTVLVVAIGLESYSFRTAIVESNHVRGKSSWTDFIRRAKAPELPVVLLTLITHDGIWDGIGTAAIGLLLVTIAGILAVETKSLLLGEGANPEDVERLERAIVAGPGVERIIHMKTLYLGPEELLVAAKIAVPPGARAEDLAQHINETEARIREALPVARVIYLEPDIYQPTASAGATAAAQSVPPVTA